MSQDRIEVVQLTGDTIVPSLSNPWDAGLDLHTTIPTTLPSNGGRAMLPTGLSIAIPKGYCGVIMPRSKLASKYGVIVGACLVDAGYRGEVFVSLINTGKDDFELRSGDKIAQMVIQPHYSDMPIVVVDRLSDGDGRGAKGITDSELRLR